MRKPFCCRTSGQRDGMPRLPKTQDEARVMIDSECFHVGLALFDSTNNIDFPGENLISTGCPMKWIALLPPSQMQNEGVRQMIQENFYDYHTLPGRQ